MIIVGVDPGFTGGIVVLDKDKIVEAWPMPIVTMKKKKTRNIKTNEDNPDGKKTKTYIANVKEYDYVRLRDLFRYTDKRYTVGKVYIERVNVRPGEGVSSTFNFGIGFGAIIASVTCTDLPYELVSPVTWTKAMLSGIAKTIDVKDRSKLAASRHFNIGSLVLDGCKQPHSGLIDASLIALYGYKKEIEIV